MFLFWFMQKWESSSSRVYCILAKLTNSNALGKLAIRDWNNWVIKELLSADLAKTRVTMKDFILA